MPTSSNFRFINSYPGRGLKPSKDTRRDVRSYVARVSHPSAGAGVKANGTRVKGEKAGSTIVFDVEITSFQNDEDDSPSVLAPVKKKPSLSTDHSLKQAEESYQQPPRIADCQDKNGAPPFQPSHVSPVHALSSHTSTPIASLAVYRKAFVPAILDNYINCMAVPIPEIDDGSPRPLLRTIWLPMVMHNPAIFQVIVLFAAAHYATYAEPAYWHHFYPVILSLKQIALQGLVNGVQLLDSPRNSNGVGTSTLPSHEEDCLIAAIAKMASYEAIYGEPAAYHTHMRAATRMLRARGGLATLGGDGLLARMLRYVDTNSAFLLGCHLYLEDQGIGICLPRHQPVRLKRFDEVGAGCGYPGQAAEERLEELNRVDVDDEGLLMVERFVRLCGTGDATRY